MPILRNRARRAAMPKRLRFAPKAALGAVTAQDVTSLIDTARQTITNLKQTAGPAASVAVSIVNDPALPAVLTRLQTIRGLAQQQAARMPSGKGGASSSAGIGLSNLIRPLDAYIYVQRHRWALPAAAMLAIFVPFAVGYRLGKGR